LLDTNEEEPRALRDYIPCPQWLVVLNLLPELAIGVDSGRHGSRSSVSRDGSDRGLGRIVDAGSRPKYAEWPNEGTPKGGTQMLAVCATTGRLDHFTALLFEQNSKQPTLRKGQR
jgi:hypothetical protein